jgi:hypothetical protein
MKYIKGAGQFNKKPAPFCVDGHHSLHAKISHHPEFDDEKQSDVRSNPSRLLTNVKTAAALF